MLSCAGYLRQDSGFGFGLLRFDHGRPVKTRAAITTTIMIAVSTTINSIVEVVTKPQSTQRLDGLSQIKPHLPAMRDYEHVKCGA